MRHSRFLVGSPLVLLAFAAAGSAGPEAAPTYLKLTDGYVVAAIYTPFVWASVAKSGGNEEAIVRIDAVQSKTTPPFRIRVVRVVQ